jgi:hypothetical protein
MKLFNMTQETLKKLEEVFGKIRATSNGSSNIDEETAGILHASSGGHAYLVIDDEKFELDMEDVEALTRHSQSNAGTNKE